MYKKISMLLLVLMIPIVYAGTISDFQSTVAFTKSTSSGGSQWTIDNLWLYNLSGTLTFNETYLNATIDARASGTSDGNNYSTAISVSGTTTKTIQISRNGADNISASFTDIDTDTTIPKWTIESLWLYNNSGVLTFNETELNSTIDARDSDTTYTSDETYINLDGTTFNLNETKLNNTIDARSSSSDVYVNESGDTMTGNLTFNSGQGITQLDFLKFNISANEPAHDEGILHWDDTDKTLELDMSAEGVHLSVGQEMYVFARNTIGSQINNGQLVFINGSSGQRPTVELAKADSASTSHGTLAMATHNVSNNNNGYFTTFGYVRDLDTSSYPAGTQLYLSDSVAGGWTNVSPASPNHSVKIGTVITQNANTGIILLRIVPSFELENLDNVESTPPSSDGGIYSWNNGNSRWELDYDVHFGDNNVTLNGSVVCTAKNGFCNQSAMVSDVWVNESGDVMTGNLTLNNTYLKFSDTNYIYSPTSVYDINTSGALRYYAPGNNPSSISHMFCGNSSSNQICLPRMVIQRGGTDLASFVSRSFAIINDDQGWLNGTDSSGVPTNMSGYLTFIGEEQKIDFNTASTGADLLVGDDLQVIGDVWLKDTGGEYHYTTRELDLSDEFRDNTLTSLITGVVSNGNLTITDSEGDSIVYIINETTKDLEKITDTVSLNLGTNSSPVFNVVYYDSVTDTSLKVSSTEQDMVVDVGQLMVGNDKIYGSIISSASQHELTRNIYYRFFDDGPIYKSGFNFNIGSTDINISTGTMKVILNDYDIINNHTLSDYFAILNNGSYVQYTNINDITQYKSGESIGNNKYFNLVCGIVATHDFTGNMLCVPQNKPSSEYTKILDAELDSTYVLFEPQQDFIKKLYTPVVRVVLLRSGGSNTIKTLSTGLNYVDLRGRGTSGGSAPSPSITDHGQLNGLTDDDHTQYLLADGSRDLTGTWAVTQNITVDGSIVCTSANGLCNQSSGSPGGSDTQIQFNDGGNFNGSSNLVFNKTNGYLGLGASIPEAGLHVNTTALFSGTSGLWTTSNFQKRLEMDADGGIVWRNKTGSYAMGLVSGTNSLTFSYADCNDNSCARTQVWNWNGAGGRFEFDKLVYFNSNTYAIKSGSDIYHLVGRSTSGNQFGSLRYDNANDYVALGMNFDDSLTVHTDNQVGINDITPDAELDISITDSTDVGLIIQGAASQSANLQEWQNSSGDALLYVPETADDICITGGNCLSTASGADGNNYSTGVSFTGTSTKTIQISRNGAANISASFTDIDTTYSAGAGLTLTGTTFEHNDTSSQASSDNSGRTYIQDITLDDYGHITSLATATETVTDTTISNTNATLQSLNITNGNLNISNTGSCIYLPGGGSLCGNTTCTWMTSPDGGTTSQVCN